jgi:hypothetical protein
VTPFIVVKLNDNENTPDPLIVDDANDDGTFEMPGLRPHRDDDSSDDEDDDVSTPKKMGHRQKRKGLFDAKTLMLEAKGETETEFFEIENCCDLKHTIDSSGFNNITVMRFLWLTCVGLTCGFRKDLCKK